jgi:FAD/FMN-containing dehydrogenase
VGGSLSVNVHGRYIGQGPIIKSVESIRVILADGTDTIATPTQNSELFYGFIGGYGGLGVITEVTLSLTDNVKVERSTSVMILKSRFTMQTSIPKITITYGPSPLQKRINL